MALPPSRYRVEERGRRLVTIDTLTGQVYGAEAAADPAPGRSRPDIVRTAAPPSSTSMGKPPATPSALAVNAGSRVSSATPAPGAAKPGVAGKLIVLVVGGLMLAVFLIATNLWILVVIPLAIPQVRTIVLTRGMAALRKYLDQAATG